MNINIHLYKIYNYWKIKLTQILRKNTIDFDFFPSTFPSTFTETSKFVSWWANDTYVKTHPET